MTRPWKIAILATLAVTALVLAYVLRFVFLPFLVALILAYILHPVVESLARRKVPRLVSVLGLYAVLGLLLAGFISWVLPALVNQGNELLQETVTGDNPKLQRLLIRGKVHVKDWLGAENWEEVVQNVRRRVMGHEGQLAVAGGEAVGTVLSAMTQSFQVFLAVLSFVALVPIYLFFLLRNLTPWWEKLKAAIPPHHREKTLATLSRIHRANAAFFRGQLTIGLTEGAVLFAGLTLMDVRFSLLFGVLYTILSFIPFLGVTIGFCAAEIFVLADTGGFTSTFFMVAGLFAAIQILEATVLQPLILGKETGLHPIGIILALLIGGNLWGIFGMLVAIPVASAAKILLEDHVWPMYREVVE